MREDHYKCPLLQKGKQFLNHECNLGNKINFPFLEAFKYKLGGRGCVANTGKACVPP